jgi:YidC/Oxa1 family membrane protein insertase
MMQYLQPQMKEIADKYKDDMEKRAAAQRELFKRNKYNPLGGCFMMFFQLPIFIGLYRGLSVDIALRDQPLFPGMRWCGNLSGPDQLLNWQEWMPDMLANETGWLGPYLNILPLLTMVLFLMQQKLFMPPPTDDQQKMMQKMMTFMMIFMGVMFFKVSAGLCLYFITSSLWGIIERKLLPKPVLVTDNLSGGSSAGVLAGIGPQTPTKSEQKAAKEREVELANRKRRNSERNKRLKERGV